MVFKNHNKKEKIHNFQNANCTAGKLTFSIRRLMSNIPSVSSSFTVKVRDVCIECLFMETLPLLRLTEIATPVLSRLFLPVVGSQGQLFHFHSTRPCSGSLEVSVTLHSFNTLRKLATDLASCFSYLFEGLPFCYPRRFYHYLGNLTVFSLFSSFQCL